MGRVLYRLQSMELSLEEAGEKGTTRRMLLGFFTVVETIMICFARPSKWLEFCTSVGINLFKTCNGKIKTWICTSPFSTRGGLNLDSVWFDFFGSSQTQPNYIWFCLRLGLVREWYSLVQFKIVSFRLEVLGEIFTLEIQMNLKESKFTLNYFCYNWCIMYFINSCKILFYWIMYLKSFY